MVAAGRAIQLTEPSLVPVSRPCTVVEQVVDSHLHGVPSVVVSVPKNAFPPYDIAEEQNREPNHYSYCCRFVITIPLFRSHLCQWAEPDSWEL